MDKVMAFSKFWQRHPPPYILLQAIAIFLGIDGAKPQEPVEQASLEELAALFPGGVKAQDLKR